MYNLYKNNLLCLKHKILLIKLLSIGLRWKVINIRDGLLKKKDQILGFAVIWSFNILKNLNLLNLKIVNMLPCPNIPQYLEINKNKSKKWQYLTSNHSYYPTTPSSAAKPSNTLTASVATSSSASKKTAKQKRKVNS